MINKTKIFTLGISALICLNLTINSVSADNPQIDNSDNYQPANPLELVAKPQIYLNQKVKISAVFDKFSTLGLDYKPALRSSKDYISFVIRDPEVTDHVLPLPELKLIIKRDKAEKLTDLDSGDKIEFTGQVFSNALGDPWMDVNNIKILTVKTKTVSDKKDSSNTKTPSIIKKK